MAFRGSLSWKHDIGIQEYPSSIRFFEHNTLKVDGNRSPLSVVSFLPREGLGT